MLAFILEYVRIFNLTFTNIFLLIASGRLVSHPIA